MNIKEELIEKVVIGMSNSIEQEHLNKLLYLLSVTFQDVDVIPTNGKQLPSERATDDDMLLKNFLGCKILKGCTDSTIERYRYVINRFHDYLGGQSYLTVTTNDIRCFLGECMKTMSTTSTNGIRLCLNSFYAWLDKEEYIRKSPCAKIDKIKVEQKEYVPVTQTDMVKLKDNCVSNREKVLIDLLDSSGIRCMEVPTIKISDIDFDSRAIVVYGKGRKERTILVTEETIEHIKVYLNERRKNGDNCKYLIARERHTDLYDKPLSKDAIFEMVKKIRDRANIPHVHIHAIRHKFASDMNNRGMNMFTIQKLLGHSSIATTQIYVQNSYSSLVFEYNKYKN